MADTAPETSNETEQTASADQETTTRTHDTTNADTKSDTDYKADAEKWQALARKHEARAKQNAEKASQYDAYLESQKTEQQKRDEHLAALEKERSDALADAARLRAAVKHGLSEDDLDLIGGSTPEEIEARAERLAARLAAAASPAAQSPSPHLGREQTPTVTGDWLRDRFTT